MTNEILLAGFGGQGILFAGKLLAYIGLMNDQEVSWLPSYGPAMRGGTCNCSVCISDKPIGSPLILTPNILIAMNQPSYDKFIGTVKPGGIVVVDSTLVNLGEVRDDISIHTIPATQLAIDNDMKGMANIIILGRLLKEVDIASTEIISKALNKVVPPKKSHLIDLNLTAIKMGQQ